MSNLSHLLRTKIQEYHKLQELDDKILLQRHYKRKNEKLEKEVQKNINKINNIYKNVYSKLDLVDLTLKKYKHILNWRHLPFILDNHEIFWLRKGKNPFPVLVTIDFTYQYRVTRMIAEKLGKSVEDIEEKKSNQANREFHYDILKIMTKSQVLEFTRKVLNNYGQVDFRTTKNLKTQIF